ncbi:hypothetical protein SAMN04488519_11290 [Algoriphagus ornithinivorans]|uniref:AB hydrolase-1 domain-containing protein n=1 Tax=Algoriphagus ornithinivorans TaxID=226506 RepID=A0A1I5JH95_9BACT|nr:alpha/beta fold hydrolase [Algoriphagus ornithinivorans]SFO71923.1 hypothetical protein SAMN04488519_11290 [Algoriphagus ornithinivorans]
MTLFLKKIKIEYTIQNPFDPEKKTIITHEDPFDKYLGVGDLLNVELKDFNYIKIHGRYFSSDLSRFLKENESIESEKKFHWLSRTQIINDIELVRKEILGDRQVILLGFGSGAGLIHYYLHEYPTSVEKVVSLNPLLFDIPKNLSFWDLLGGFESIVNEYSINQIIRFSIQSSQPYFFMDKTIRDSVLKANIEEFTRRFDLKNLEETNLSLGVRAFEHELDNGIYDLGPFRHFLSLLSIEWQFDLNSFDWFKGTNYDLGREFKSKLTLIGGVYNLVLDPKSFDVIGEFYPNSSVYLLKDGFDFSITRNKEMWAEMISSFCSDDISDQIKIFKLLQEKDLLFQGKSYNSVRVGK